MRRGSARGIPALGLLGRASSTSPQAHPECEHRAVDVILRSSWHKFETRRGRVELPRSHAATSMGAVQEHGLLVRVMGSSQIPHVIPTVMESRDGV
eukprot:scaffold940_cov569-Prasinococcus_capsulatus_cf.AAC.12